MLKYLSDNYGERASLGDRNLLDFLRDETIRLQLLLVSKLKYNKRNYYFYLQFPSNFGINHILG